jgi:HEAT repeat protein
MVAELQARVENLVTSRETLLSRVAEWQHQARNGDADAIDLAEFIAALSHDILALEHRSVTAEKREAELRERLLAASLQADADPRATNAAATEPHSTDEAPAPEPVAEPACDDRDPQARIDTLLRLGRSGNADASQAIRTELGAPEHGVRAAAYQALGQLLEHEPARLEAYLRRGIADTDPRVRRRAALTAASARGLDLRLLFNHLRLDPDPQVRRVVKEILRHTAPEAEDAVDEAEVTAQTGSGAA